MAVKPRLEVPEHAQQRAAALVGRTWVLDRINRWLDEDSKPFLLLVANPGWGKTALSAWLAGAGPEPEHANEATALAGLRAGWDAAHFCVARRRAGSVDPNLFAQRLAEQLAVRIDGFGEAAMARIAPNVQADVTVRENWGTVVGVNIERLIVNAPDAQTVYGEAVRKPLEALERSAPGVEVRILVDALDEAVRDAGTDIVELVAGSVDLPAGVRWVLTTRNERRVLDQFGAEDAEKIYLGDEFAVDAKRDLRAYVAERLATDARLTLAAPRAAELESKLAEHASDNFLYAEWVLKEIAERKREPSDVERLPQGLYGLYREFLDRLLPKDPQRFEEA